MAAQDLQLTGIANVNWNVFIGKSNVNYFFKILALNGENLHALYHFE